MPGILSADAWREEVENVVARGWMTLARKGVPETIMLVRPYALLAARQGLNMPDSFFGLLRECQHRDVNTLQEQALVG